MSFTYTPSSVSFLFPSPMLFTRFLWAHRRIAFAVDVEVAKAWPPMSPMGVVVVLAKVLVAAAMYPAVTGVLVQALREIRRGNAVAYAARKDTAKRHAHRNNDERRPGRHRVVYSVMPRVQRELVSMNRACEKLSENTHKVN